MNKIYRAQIYVWVFFGGLSSLPWLAVWGNAYSLHGVDAVGVIFSSIVSAFAFAWLFSFRIAVTPAEVVFRSLFRGNQSIRHEEIKIVRLTWSLKPRSRGPLRLVVEPRDGSGVRELNISAKVFSMAAIDAVLNLGADVAQADDGGLRDGIVMKKLRNWKKGQKA